MLAELPLSVLLGYTAVALASYVIPGPDVAVIVPRAMLRRRIGFATAAGVQTGMLVHATLAIVGVGAAIAARPSLLTILQVAGGAYLAWLGATDLRSAWRGPATTPQSGPAPVHGPGRAFVTGVFVNLLNPKAVLFFVAILPQFVPAGAPVTSTIAALATLDIAAGLLVWTVLVLACDRLGRVTSPRAQRRGALAMGAILVALGVLFVARGLAGL